MIIIIHTNNDINNNIPTSSEGPPTEPHTSPGQPSHDLRRGAAPAPKPHGREGSAGAPKGLQLDSQISYFSRKIKDLISKSNENSLLRDKKSSLSLEKSSFLLDRRGCIISIN